MDSRCDVSLSLICCVNSLFKTVLCTLSSNLKSNFTKNKKNTSGAFFFTHQLLIDHFCGVRYRLDLSKTHTVTQTYTNGYPCWEKPKHQSQEFLQTKFNLNPQHPCESTTLLHSCIQLIDRQTAKHHFLGLKLKLLLQVMITDCKVTVTSQKLN